jgi:hypothetical protein
MEVEYINMYQTSNPCTIPYCYYGEIHPNTLEWSIKNHPLIFYFLEFFTTDFKVIILI